MIFKNLICFYAKKKEEEEFDDELKWNGDAFLCHLFLLSLSSSQFRSYRLTTVLIKLLPYYAPCL